MRRIAWFALAAALLASAVLVVRAEDEKQEMPQMPAPQKEHAWLKQFVGEWEISSEAQMDPSQPAQPIRGLEKARMLGEFFVIGEASWEIGTTKFQTVMTVGYDAKQKKYVGTWVSSIDGHMWHYVGTVDEKGTTITLEADGPSMTEENKMCKFRDVTEFKSKDHRELTSYVQGADGKWNVMCTFTFKRKQ